MNEDILINKIGKLMDDCNEDSEQGCVSCIYQRPCLTFYGNALDNPALLNSYLIYLLRLRGIGAKRFKEAF